MAELAHHDAIKHQVFRRFAQALTVIQTALLIVQLYLRGPFHPNTLSSVGVIAIFGGLLAVQPRLRSTVPLTAMGLGVCAVLSVVLERKSDGEITMMQFFLFSFPMIATLLANQILGGLFLLFAAADASFLLAAQTDLTAAAIIAVVAKTGFGAALIVLVGTFDRERLAARRLAAQREQGLKEAVARAEHAATSRTLFLANMSHEIRTPMNGVLGLSRILVDQPLPEAQHQLARTILDSGKSLLNILDDILDLSKMDAGALLIAPGPVDIRETISQVLRLMAAKAQEAGVTLESSVSPDIPAWVHVDGHRLRQIVTNLLSNAIKFTPGGGVQVKLSYYDQRVHAEVADSGMGMDEETLSRIFRPFEQADASTARRHGGTGLGLAICRKLCELMGGHLGARSQLGVGSTFFFEVDAPPQPAPEQGHQGDPSLQPLGIKVLVAEDTRVNQLVIRHFLERIGADVRIVSDGAQAIEAVKTEAFDAVLMDLQMPEMDGLEATRHIRAMGAPRAEVPILALTASVMAEQRAACFEAGMNDVLMKPLELEALHGALASWKSA
ncbi:MAG: ATP-binding protein [Myxococcota bacterium]